MRAEVVSELPILLDRVARRELCIGLWTRSNSVASPRAIGSCVSRLSSTFLVVGRKGMASDAGLTPRGPQEQEANGAR